MSDRTLHINRIFYLLRYDLVENRNRNLLLVTGMLVFGIFFFHVTMEESSVMRSQLTYLEDHLLGRSKFHISFFPISLLLSGFLFTSLSYPELKHAATRTFYLGLPAGNLEKVFSKWLLTAVLFPLVWILVYQLFALYTDHWYRGTGFEMVHLSLFDPWLWLWWGVYVLLQSIFFLGTVAMPRFSLVKTAVILAILVFLLVQLFDFSLYTVLPIFSDETAELAGRNPADFHGYESRFGEQQAAYMDRLPKLFFMVFGLLISPFLLITSYFKLKEKEA